MMTDDYSDHAERQKPTYTEAQVYDKILAERERCATAVEKLIGKDSGNWNRAIIYAAAAIRKEPT